MVTRHYVYRVLHETTPAALPIERPTVFELVVNLKAVRTLGVTVPQTAAPARGRGHAVMDRRTFICTVASGALAWANIAGAQQANKVWRVGFIASGIRPPGGAVPAPLREKLHALGFAEGKDVTYEGRWGEILKELVPTAKRVAVLWNAENYAMTLRYREIEKAAQLLGMGVDPLGVREPDDFNVAFAAMTRARPDALMMLTDAFTNLHRQRLIDYVNARQIPAIYEFGNVVRDGGLISYGSDLDETLKLAAVYVAKILKGAKPSDLPVEQPNRYFLVVNVKAAKNLGLTISPSLLLRADEIIQ